MSILNIARTSLYNVQANIRSICIGKYLQNSGSRYQDNERSKSSSQGIVFNYDDGDRSQVIDYMTSIEYVESPAYQECYGNHLVWELYSRRAKHSRHYLVPTRKKCISRGKLLNSSPCPICRDMYLVLDYRHVQLLKQFISPHYDGVLPTRVTGLCQFQHKKLMIQVLKAKDYGTISFDIPARQYDYKHFHEVSLKNLNSTEI